PSHLNSDTYRLSSVRHYLYRLLLSLFFFNTTAPPEISTLSLHDALPISVGAGQYRGCQDTRQPAEHVHHSEIAAGSAELTLRNRSEEHTSELQSHLNLVCRLLLEKKKKIKCNTHIQSKSPCVAQEDYEQK